MNADYAPTCHLRWAMATDSQEGAEPCATKLRYYLDDGPTGYVLQQWWFNGKEGEWRNVEMGDDKHPPAYLTDSV